MNIRRMVSTACSILLCMIILCSCSSQGDSVPDEKSGRTEPDTAFDSVMRENAEKVVQCYDHILKEKQQGGVMSVDVMKEVLKSLGKAGYAAVDVDNQVDMVNSDQAESFCRQVEQKKEADLIIVAVRYSGDFIYYNFTAKDGKVEVSRNSILWNNGEPKFQFQENYSAHTWVYTKEGYLFFEKYHPGGYDGPDGHTAIRVGALDEKCREMNRKYIRIIGYGVNNMFITDWSEADYESLDFYDMYECLYPIDMGQPFPYEIDYVGKYYDISRAEFEKIIMDYFQIDSVNLQQKTHYNADSQTYRYRTRGIHDCGYTMNIPYPEVVSMEEQEDGTIKLKVNAVWPHKNLECAFAHEVVIRPLSDGRFQYVSNHVIPSGHNVSTIWYRNRMTDEEWQQRYGSS